MNGVCRRSSRRRVVGLFLCRHGNNQRIDICRYKHEGNIEASRTKKYIGVWQTSIAQNDCQCRWRPSNKRAHEASDEYAPSGWCKGLMAVGDQERNAAVGK